MKPIQTLFLLLCFAGIASIPGMARNLSPEAYATPYTLYPPLNFTGTAVECNTYLQWMKPEMPNGTTPAGLAGYYIYRDGVMINYISDGSILSFYDYHGDYGTFSYTITANYDLSFYGLPGQFGESTPAGPLAVVISCSFPLPFYDPWDSGNFASGTWQFTPAQGNWAILTTDGNPAPTAIFTGSPVLQNYAITMNTRSLPGEPWVCASMYIEFDYRLNDISAGGTEKLTVLYYMDNAWFTALEISNLGSTAWTHEKIDISQVCGKKFRIGFKASGSNSANIGKWSVDNIQVNPVCKGPSACGYSKSGNTIHLFWQPPQCDSLQLLGGYNIYRADQTNPSFVKLNASPITGLDYEDHIPPTVTINVFSYLIYDRLYNWMDSLLLCEAPCDTLSVEYSVGINVLENYSLRLFPQPVNDLLEIISPTPIETCELFSIVGNRVLDIKGAFSNEMIIPVTSLPTGIYLVKIKNASGTLVKRVTVMH